MNNKELNMEVETKLREMLVPVLGLEGPHEVIMDKSLVRDLGADSIDFVEIVYLIEKNFGVVLKTGEIVAAGVSPEELFSDDRLTERGAELIAANLGEGKSRYRAGMTKVELFSALTVRDLATVIALKLGERENRNA